MTVVFDKRLLVGQIYIFIYLFIYMFIIYNLF
jgi:hypothetical protein